MVQGKMEDGKLIISLFGRIDSANAAEYENKIQEVVQANPAQTIVVDCEKLDYATSAGLRVILRLKKAVDDTSLINVNQELYDIFEMTGFTDMMSIQKAYRVFSVEGCEVIGEGANGKVYRIDRDTIVKVYRNPDALPEIQRERELARTAFVAGVPTAIPYDVVRIEGGGYGSVFELLNATSFVKLLIKGEKTLDEVAEMSIDLLKTIHSKTVAPDKMPDMKAVALDWAAFLKDYLPAEQADKLYALVEAVPEDMHMMHGDYHLKNIMFQNGESLLIDMDTLCHGHPVFELASMYNAYIGFSAIDKSHAIDFLGIDYDTCCKLWHKSLELYLGTTDESVIRSVEEKAEIIGLTRLMRRTIRRDGMNTDEGRQLIDYCKKTLMELVPKVDTLVF